MIGDDASKKKKGTAFKDSTKSEEELNNEDMALLTRKFKHFFNKSSNTRKWEVSTQMGWKEKLMYFKCRNLGHIEMECLSQQHRHNKKRKICAIWDEINKSENRDDYDEERESLSCFMTIFNER